jgi:hypothetical protein
MRLLLYTPFKLEPAQDVVVFTVGIVLNAPHSMHSNNAPLHLGQ